MSIELTNELQLTSNLVPPSARSDDESLTDNRWYMFEVSGSHRSPGLKQLSGGVAYPLPSSYSLIARDGSEQLLELIVAAMVFPVSGGFSRSPRP